MTKTFDLSLNKFISFLQKGEVVAHKYYCTCSSNGSTYVSYVECLSQKTGITFLLYIPSKYSIVVKERKNFHIIYLTEVETGHDKRVEEYLSTVRNDFEVANIGETLYVTKDDEVLLYLLSVQKPTKTVEKKESASDIDKELEDIESSLSKMQYVPPPQDEPVKKKEKSKKDKKDTSKKTDDKTSKESTEPKVQESAPVVEQATQEQPMHTTADEKEVLEFDIEPISTHIEKLPDANVKDVTFTVNQIEEIEYSLGITLLCINLKTFFDKTKNEHNFSDFLVEKNEQLMQGEKEYREGVHIELESQLNKFKDAVKDKVDKFEAVQKDLEDKRKKLDVIVKKIDKVIADPTTNKTVQEDFKSKKRTTAKTLFDTTLVMLERKDKFNLTLKDLQFHMTEMNNLLELLDE